MNPKYQPNKIALFGGTFDPVHLGHLIVAEWAWDALDLDKVIFIPNHIHPFRKRRDITPPQQRLDMLELALQAYPNFEVSDVELERKGVSYTVDTLEYLHKIYPDSELFFLIGADNLLKFDEWKEPQRILELAKIVIYNRDDSRIEDDTRQERMIYLNSPNIKISSTQIRERIKQGHSCKSMLPLDVWRYIEENHIYK